MLNSPVLPSYVQESYVCTTVLGSKLILYIFVKGRHGIKKLAHIGSLPLTFVWISIIEISNSRREGNEGRLKKGHKLFSLTHFDSQIIIGPLSDIIILQLPMLEINCLFY